MNARWRIAITLCTRQRPQLLRNCVESILQLAVPDDIEPLLVVVENDTTSECQTLLEDLARQAGSRWKVIYAQESVPGIPIARNRALELALAEHPDWIAFVDDDETVDRLWLERMVLAAEEFNCDVLHGPVEYVYPDAMPEWLDAKQTRRRPRGQKRRAAATNNTFMKSRLVSEDGLALRFDETLRFTGGSDTEFFLRAADRGATICWVDDAWVRESVGWSRLTMRWQWMRVLRVAVTASSIHRKRKGLGAACARYIPKAVSRLANGIIIAGGGLLVIVFVPKWGQRLMFLGGKGLASGIGSLMGLARITPQPYRTVE